MVPIPVPCTSLSYESHIQDEFEEEEEEEINLVTPDSDVSSVDALSIPEGFDVVNVIRDLKVGNAMTKLQEESNNAVEELLTNHIDAVNSFCSEEFECLQGMMEEQSLNIDDADPQPVHADKISRFYKLCHQHQTSSEFKARKQICTELLAAPRDRDKQQKQAMVKSVGGYCIAKARLKHRKRLTNYCFKLGDSEQQQSNEAKCMLKIIDTLAVNESILQTSTQYPESLIETAFRQYQTRGLTNITDKVFQFFISTCDKCLHLLVDENLNIHGQNLFEKCNASISKDMDLFNVFLTSIQTITQDDFMKDDSVVGLLGEMVMISSCSELLFQELSEKFLLVMVNQYRKDFLMNLSVQKKMAHRKQIQVGSQSKGNVKKAGLKIEF
ncbi:hypothetical protein FSP39_012046 [Pinctada imbricata]|uniref:Uncharacterized protein n=1 Tax=Pinctada imbricata TaxID=66713 RepID=A0AA88YCL7_PINIB|nr:hypothetical protein FSP39_012046 [Pinctada imbricata]